MRNLGDIVRYLQRERALAIVVFWLRLIDDVVGNRIGHAFDKMLVGVFVLNLDVCAADVFCKGDVLC